MQSISNDSAIWILELKPGGFGSLRLHLTSYLGQHRYHKGVTGTITHDGANKS